MLDEPFQHERCLALDAPQPVEHIDQQDIELPVAGCGSQFLNHIALAGGDFGTGHTFFNFFHHHTPALLLRKLAAGNFLHRDVIVIDLAFGGDPIFQRRTLGVHRQVALQRHEIGIVQPLLIGLRDLDLFSMLVCISHRVFLYMAVSRGFPVITTIL